VKCEITLLTTGKLHTIYKENFSKIILSDFVVPRLHFSRQMRSMLQHWMQSADCSILCRVSPSRQTVVMTTGDVTVTRAVIGGHSLANGIKRDRERPDARSTRHP